MARKKQVIRYTVTSVFEVNLNVGMFRDLDDIRDRIVEQGEILDEKLEVIDDG